MKMLKYALLAIASLLALPIDRASAQQGRTSPYASIADKGDRLDKAAAEMLEASLNSNPDDLAARIKLLGFYSSRDTVRLTGPEAAIAARRRHILWLIEHHPGSEVHRVVVASTDPGGHPLADKDGYALASKLWTQKVELQGNDIEVLNNAAFFFLLTDKERPVALLKRAQQIAPNDARWSDSLGYVYALSILGVDMMTRSGLAVSHNAAAAKGDFARRAREELEKSTDLVMVGRAAMTIAQYGMTMDTRFRQTFAVDYVPLAEALYAKAQELEPANRQWSNALEQFRKMQLDIQEDRQRRRPR